MKKITTIVIIMLVSMVSFAGKDKSRDRHHFIVEGSFLSQKNISYTVYQENQEGKFVAIERSKARKYYSFVFNTGHKYIIRFQNKKGDVKFLMVDAVQRGYFMVDVDWRKPYDGKITYEKIGYCLTPFTNMTKPVLLAQK